MIELILYDLFSCDTLNYLKRFILYFSIFWESVIKSLAFLFLFLSLNVFSAELGLKKNGELLKIVSLSTTHSGKILGIKAKEINLYNAWRGYSRTYVGYALYNLLDNVYGESWKSARTISFKAIDGYTMVVRIKKMLKAAKGKVGLLAFKEKGKSGFTPVKKGAKLVDPAPYYLVWSNFSDGDKASHGDNLKWPYQLKEINILY
ncbi:hypothetical protein A9Q84_10780 [Halobacteriovorax marinus]|uniref:Oxidoreductase molybdopterin-binding domain-containing protein n=1 Tax=Halobacteriovorax marinus TaxID=97084 RepID=A0A1Y5F7D0_9BACT|nr:hypothetical protein A9Q84_10780 [Halobacteriovorax marinus]